MKFLKLIRYENLILLAAAQLIFRFGFLEMHPNLPLALNTWQYLLFVLAGVLIAAGGAIMENISGNDKYNQVISEDHGYNYFIIVNVVAVSIGAYLAYHIGNFTFITGFILGSAMLY